MIKGTLYVRVSQDRQLEGYSHEAQGEQGYEYAGRHGIEVARAWTVAESAKEEGRRAFQEMVEFLLKHNDVRAMIFEKADRMTRNYPDLVTIYDLIEKHGKVAHFFKDNFWIDKDSKSSDKLRLDILVVLARNYINNLREEVLKGMNQKVKNGGYPTLAGLGYLNDRQTRDVIKDLERWDKVKKLFQLAATGNRTIDELEEVAAELGLNHPSREEPICRSTVHRILTNPFYYGMMRWRGELVPGKHEPMISKALFDRVQEVLGRQNRPRTKKFAFRAIGTCGHCGSPLTAEIKTRTFKNGTKREYTYYHCTGHKAGKVCTGSYIREEELAAELGEPLKGLKVDEPMLDLIRDALRQSFGSEVAFHKERMAALQAELTKIKNRLEASYNDRLDGLITPEEFRHKAEGWRNRQVEIQEEIGAHQKADVTYLEEASRILDLAHRAHALYMEQPDPFERRKLLDLMVSKVVVVDGRAVSNLREPFETLSKVLVEAGSANGCPKWWT